MATAKSVLVTRAAILFLIVAFFADTLRIVGSGSDFADLGLPFSTNDATTIFSFVEEIQQALMLQKEENSNTNADQLNHPGTKLILPSVTKPVKNKKATQHHYSVS